MIIFFLWITFSSTIISVPPLIQVLCQVAYKEIHFMTMIGKSEIQLEKTTKYGQ